jgi:plasmid stabilization system protein ParE
LQKKLQDATKEFQVEDDQLKPLAESHRSALKELVAATEKADRTKREEETLAQALEQLKPAAEAGQNDLCTLQESLKELEVEKTKIGMKVLALNFQGQTLSNMYDREQQNLEAAQKEKDEAEDRLKRATKALTEAITAAGIKRQRT